jgi:hypothetical protein
LARQSHIELKRYVRYSVSLSLNRIEKYDRDLKRWEYMDEEAQRESLKIQSMQAKYLTGR